MADVARRAGVSVTTVSHALNKTRYVAPDTIELVKAAVRDIGYRQNQTARALATSTSTTVGMAMSITSNPYFAGLAHQIEAHLRAKGFSLILGNTDDSPELARQVLADLQSRQVAGIITAPLEGDDALSTEVLDLHESGMPIVFIDRPASLPLDQVFSENQDSILQLTRHLADNGHARIAYVSGTTASLTSVQREAAFGLAVATLGLDPADTLILHGESDEETAYQVTRAHLDSPARATALVIGNNQMALGTLRAVRDLGLRIPEDIAIVSFDDFEAADLLRPGLTVAKQDVEKIATIAADLLLARIKDPKAEPQRIAVPTTFVHRGSCGCTDR